MVAFALFFRNTGLIDDSLYQLLLVALGGALGAAARYGASVWVMQLWEEPRVLATWGVNLVGCLLIGMLAPMLGRVGLADELQFFFLVGFLGSLTTFSTFSLETVVLWQEGLGAAALLNAVGSVVLGVICVWIGLKLGRMLV